jgi:hypothetical protein
LRVQRRLVAGHERAQLLDEGGERGLVLGEERPRRRVARLELRGARFGDVQLPAQGREFGELGLCRRLNVVNTLCS